MLDNIDNNPFPYRILYLSTICAWPLVYRNSIPPHVVNPQVFS